MKNKIIIARAWRILVIMALGVMACWPGQALADLTYKTDVTGTFATESDYGTVAVTLNTSNTATVVITPLTSPDLDFVNGSNLYPVELNVNATSFAATAGVDGSSTGASTSIGSFTITGASALGTFNLEAYLASGTYPESFTIALTE